MNIEVKASLQLSSEIIKINSKCAKNFRRLAKKKKNKASQKYQDGDKDKNKAKSHNFLSINTSQSQT